jgi:hypothetical protein
MNTITRYDWYLCDQCSSHPNDLCHGAGIIKDRKMRRSCDWSLCDSNNDLVNNRGWFCKSGTSEVLVPEGSKQTGRRIGRGDGLTVLPSHPANQPQGFEVILPQQSVACVPCQGAAAGGWCSPSSGKPCGFSCKPCDQLFSGNTYLAGRGWFCDDSSTDSPNVCVNSHNIALVDVAQFTTVDAATNTSVIKIPGRSMAAAIEKKACHDTAFCLWGSIAGAVLLVIVTAGIIAVATIPAGFALTAEAAGTALEYAGDQFIMDVIATGNTADVTAAMDLIEDGWVVVKY